MNGENRSYIERYNFHNLTENPEKLSDLLYSYKCYDEWRYK